VTSNTQDILAARNRCIRKRGKVPFCKVIDLLARPKEKKEEKAVGSEHELG